MEPPDFSLLPTLNALLQEGSVTAAARRMGLSTPAMSHALARLRLRLRDPLLVRSGRGMVLTPRAESLKARVHSVVTEAQQTLEPDEEFHPDKLTRTFVVHATDYVLAVLGLWVDRACCQQAPGMSMRFIPNTPSDAASLREGTSDLAVGIYADLPPEMRNRLLMTDRLICVVRQGHPKVGKRLTLDNFVDLPHIQIAPRGQPGGYVDDLLAERGLSRRVARAVPYFQSALQMAAQTDYVLTVSERLARQLGPSLNLQLLEPPLSLRPYGLNLVWHPRYDGDAAHRFVRDLFVRGAGEMAAFKHADALTRLERSGKGRTRQP